MTLRMFLRSLNCSAELGGEHSLLPEVEGHCNGQDPWILTSHLKSPLLLGKTSDILELNHVCIFFWWSLFCAGEAAWLPQITSLLERLEYKDAKYCLHSASLVSLLGLWCSEEGAA